MSGRVRPSPSCTNCLSGVRCRKPSILLQWTRRAGSFATPASLTARACRRHCSISMPLLWSPLGRSSVRFRRFCGDAIPFQCLLTHDVPLNVEMWSATKASVCRNLLMEFIETALKGAFLIRQKKIEDHRGYFARAWCREEFIQHDLTPNMLQLNTAFSFLRGTV